MTFVLGLACGVVLGLAAGAVTVFVLVRIAAVPHDDVEGVDGDRQLGGASQGLR